MSVVTTTLLNASGVIGQHNYELISIDIRREVNRIPRATLALMDGDATTGQFTLSNQPDFEPGKELEIRLRYESLSEDTTVFKGRVVRHSVEAGGQGSQLCIELKDAAVALTRTPKSVVFVDRDDAQVIGELAKAAGLKVGRLEATQPRHAHIVQYYCTDWDFIVSRAEAQGLLVSAHDGELSVRKIDLSAPPKQVFEYGLSEIYELEFSVDAVDWKRG